MAIRFVRRCLILVLFLTLMTSCDNGGGSTGTWADPTVEPSASAPVVESTGVEPPAPTGGGDKPAVKIAGGPIGDGGQEPNDDGSVCVDVRWLGGQDGANLGDGIAFKVTEVRLHDVRRAGVSCGDHPCQGYIFQSNSDNCGQGVRPGDTDGTLSLYGRILCSAPAQDCREFRSRLKRQTITIPAAQPDGEQTDGPTDEPTQPEPSTPDEQPSPAD